MRIYVVIILCVWSMLGIKAQIMVKELSLDLKPVFKMDKKMAPVQLIQKTNDEYVWLYSYWKNNSTNQLLIKFTDQLTPTDDQLDFFSGTMDEFYKTINVININGHVYHCFTYERYGSLQYYAQEIDLNSFSIGSEILLGRIDDQLNRTNLSVPTLLKNDTIFALIIPEPGKKNEPAVLTVNLFNQNLKKINSNLYTLKIDRANLLENNWLLRANSDLILVAENDLNDDAGVLFKPLKNPIHIYHIKNNKINLIHQIMPHGKYHQIDICANDDDIVFCGFYSKIDFLNIKGTYFQRFNFKTGALQHKRYETLGESFFVQLANENKKLRIQKSISKSTHEDRNYILMDSYLSNSGELTMVAEQLEIKDNGGFGSEYKTKNLAIVSLNKDGAIDWSKKIGKNNSHDQVGYYSSYIPFRKDSILYLFYTDAVSNLSRETEPFSKAFREEEALVCSKIYPNGQIEKFIIATNNTLEGFRIRTDVYEVLDDNSLLLFAQKPSNNKYQRFISLHIN